jgi:HEAT repeat protein
MTRLGHFLTILTVALVPAVNGSAFAQTVYTVTPRVDVQVPPIDVHVPPVDVQVPAVAVQVPRVEIPRIEVPPIEIPLIEIPALDMQQFEMPPFEMPEFEMPAFEMPAFEMPHFEMPQFDMPHFEIPQIDLSHLDMSRMQEQIAEVGRLAQASAREMSRERVEEIRERAREMAERDHDMAVHVQIGPQGPKRAWDRCNDRDSDRLYDCGRDALDDKQWDRAVDYFGKVAASKGERADAALYWKAYAQNKLGQRAEALTTIAEFKSAYAKSRWGNDVSALEIDVRQHSGQPVKPGETSDDDLKLLALQALMGNNSAEAVPMLEKILQGPQSPKVKDRALFVLAQNPAPTARAIVVKVAKGGANPDLQARAVRYLGEINSPESRQALSEVYGTTADPEVKRNILRSYMVAHDRDHLVAAARQEQDQSLRVEAIRQLGNMRADDALAELYARESSAEVKKQIIRSLGNTGNADKLMSLAQTEQDPELRRTAIRTLGNLRRAETGPRLIALYEKEQSPDVRKAVIDALFIQSNATALVDLARKERDVEIKKELVRKLATMKDKEATDYMLELLK